MDGLLWKALRREWFVVRWPAFLWLCLLRGLLRVRWFVLGGWRGIGDGIAAGWRKACAGLRAFGAWFTEGWGPNWIQWRWAGLAPVVVAGGIVLRELVRPFVAFVRGLFGELEPSDRKWILPSITGTIGLLLLVLLFLSQSGGNLRSDTDPTLGRPEVAAEPKSQSDAPAPPQRIVDLEPRIEPTPWDDPPALETEPDPALRDPFGEFDPAPELAVEPDPGPEPELEPFPDFDPIPTVEPVPPVVVEEPLLSRRPDAEPLIETEIPEWPADPPPAKPTFPADLEVSMNHGPSQPPWQSQLADDTDFFVASNPRRIDFDGIGPLDPVDEPDGWDRRAPRGEFDPVLPVVHSVREFAEATASSTLVRQERPRIEFVAFMEERSRVGETCAIEFRAINVGEVPVERLVVRIDLPEQFDHRFGRRIDYEVGTLAPGERRSARLVVACTTAGAGTVQVRLEGGAINESRNRAFEVARNDPPANPVHVEQPVPTPIDPEPESAEFAPTAPAPERDNPEVQIEQRPRKPAAARRPAASRLDAGPSCCCPPRF